MDNYKKALQFIQSRRKFKKSPTLERMQLFMKKLGNPQRRLNMIHVAGTNGKGSTIAFLRNIFEVSGLSVGTFTSPFLIKFNERISVDGNPIDNDEVIQLVQKIKPIVKELDESLPESGPTEFEVVTAMMFEYFAIHPVDIILIEVGIGGKYDSTNIINPKLSVITTIGYDHMKLLGNTLPKIASQKAGIIKYKVPVVTGRIANDALRVIKRYAKMNDSSLYSLSYDYDINTRNSNGWYERFDLNDKRKRLIFKDLKINMLGQFQIDNAATAIKAFIQYQYMYNLPVEYSTINKGIENTFWAGRFERLNENPLIIIDGAHNEPAIKQIDKLIRNRFSNNDFYIILSILADKQYKKMIKILASINNVHLILTEFNGPGNRQVADLSQLTDGIKSKFPIKFVNNWKQAIVQVVSDMSIDDVLLITGSLYFISDVRKLF